ncbi:Wzz/FepE/Etk N-terminal domain-containing protein [candidate division WOR-3 bacterium]|nr:Wzz/FepE/Etk N-terminal domain-containing protein [candidate division WOR-3 bacterium]
MANDPNIRDYVAVMVKRRKILFFNVITITLLAVVISLILPRKYTSVGRLMPPVLSTAGMTDLPQMLMGAGLPFGMGATPSDLFAALLTSRTILDRVIEECELMDYYKQKTITATREKLRELTEIGVSPEGILSISVTDRDPNMAAKIVDAYIRSLDRLNRETSMSVGKRNRVFLEERLVEVKQELRDAEDSLKIFQERHRIIFLPEELKQVVGAMSSLLARRMTKEIELGIVKMYATMENPEVLRLERELSLIDNQISDMGYVTDPEKFGVGFSIPLQDVPEISLKLARLMRDVEVEQKVFALLIEQYEQAKLQEVRDTPTVDILDIPEVPEERSFPRRTRIVIVAFAFSLFVGIGFAFFAEYMDRIKNREEG